ncbi:non-specific lipid-transfer protein 3-like [Neltuma alba]|uniref:non-specific lipid-transfer protein 3-like n=1 Tax=Neltuma alba TaxID=207710 RepID=UPI0010A4BC7D|nr:non-specific lipid-transfer protein 3-like [Prosopis alba]
MALNNVNILTVTVLILMVVTSEMVVFEAEAAGECGRTPIGSAAASLAPCLAATRNVRARVPPACCARVGAMIRMSPRCLCAVLLSPMARSARINPAIAVTVPKRCNIRNRPAGKKCGRYTVP